MPTSKFTGNILLQFSSNQGYQSTKFVGAWGNIIFLHKFWKDFYTQLEACSFKNNSPDFKDFCPLNFNVVQTCTHLSISSVATSTNLNCFKWIEGIEFWALLTRGRDCTNPQGTRHRTKRHTRIRPSLPPSAEGTKLLYTAQHRIDRNHTLPKDLLSQISLDRLRNS